MTKQQTKLVSVEMWVTAENLSHHEQKQVLAVRSSRDGSAEKERAYRSSVGFSKLP